jgi:NADH-ubiquinone oxidoreductase chain 5
MYNSRLACVINWIRDLPVIIRVINTIRFIIIIRILTKSSLIIFHSWLARAIERPTPVSSLLHSATMVCARIILLNIINIINFYIIICIIICTFSIRYKRIINIDQKKTIANSTSSQLCLIFVLSSIYMNILFDFYLLSHSIFKSRLFFICGYIIHNINTQSKLILSTSNIEFIILISICRLTYIITRKIKDNLLNDFISIIYIIIIIILFITTIFYSLSIINITYTVFMLNYVWILVLLIILTWFYYINISIYSYLNTLYFFLLYFILINFIRYIIYNNYNIFNLISYFELYYFKYSLILIILLLLL